jgi:hypothetical protein
MSTLSADVLEVNVIQHLIFLFLGSNQRVRALLLRINRSWAAFCRSLACTRLILFQPGLFVHGNDPLLNLRRLERVPVVHLQFASKVDSHFFEAMRSMSPYLETLTLSYSVDDQSLQAFAPLLETFTRLRKLEFNFAKFVHPALIWRRTSRTVPQNLESLVLQYCQNVDDEFIQGLAETSLHESLTNLDLFGSSAGGFGDAGLMALASSGFQRLQRLVLGSSFLKPVQVSDAALFHAIPRFRELVVLDLSASLVSDGTVTEILLRLPRLLLLKLASCPRIAFAPPLSSSALPHTSEEANPQRHLALETLSLSDCPRMSDGGLKTIAHRFPELRDLDLSFCSQVTDTGLASVGNLVSLRSLKLVFVSSITSVGVRHLLRQKTLQYVNFRNCPLIGEPDFEPLNELSTRSDLTLEH